MNYKKFFPKTGKAGIVSNTVLLITVAGLVNCADGQGLQITVTPPVVVVAPPVVAVQDNYVYYPSYGVYYNSSRHQYAYLDGGVWALRPAPMGVSVDVLMASPSVKMDFHDSPSNHHAAMAKKYPKNYRATRPDQKAEGHDEHHER